MLEWLADEFERALSRIRPAHAQWFASQGVTEDALARAGGYGVARVRFEPSGSWEPADEDGEAAIILPAFIPSGEGAARVLYDLIAFRPSRPEAFARRRMDAVWLGEDELELAHFWHLPIVVRSDALSWLRAGAAGVVPLDWTEAIPRLLEWGELMGEDEAMARRLRHELTRSLMDRMPRIAAEPRRKERAPERDIDFGRAA